METNSTAAPCGYRAVTPYLTVKGAAAAIDFYKSVFGAGELMRMEAPGGKIGHAELQIGDAVVMLADEWPDMDCKGPEAFGGSPVSLLIYVDDVDATAELAVAAGATLKRAPKDEFWGDRMGTVVDPFGHVWQIATHVEDVPDDEMERRAEAAMREMAGG
ncbi:MAG TPA: VOC family protein [Rhodospirillales bacterium]|jgi:PhnB protein|nr:VOC family protein [Rhodospirillales bacterium]